MATIYQAPVHLAAETRAWVEGVVREYQLESHHLRLLQLAGEAWDRAQQARAALKKHGVTYTDRFGQPCARPEVAIERDSRTSFARLLRELQLDVEAPPDPRPSRLPGGRRA
jgi:phage terminase small subunit